MHTSSSMSPRPPAYGDYSDKQGHAYKWKYKEYWLPSHSQIQWLQLYSTVVSVSMTKCNGGWGLDASQAKWRGVYALLDPLVGQQILGIVETNAPFVFSIYELNINCVHLICCVWQCMSEWISRKGQCGFLKKIELCLIFVHDFLSGLQQGNDWKTFSTNV